MFLKKLIHTLTKKKVDYALVGGYAVTLHGAMRGTVDVDLICRWDKTQLQRFADTMHELGLISRLPVTAPEIFSFRDEYIKNRNLVAWSFYSKADPLDVVDLIITHDLRGKKVKTLRWQNESLRILSIADLIKMKKDAGRPQDLADVEALEKLESLVKPR